MLLRVGAVRVLVLLQPAVRSVRQAARGPGLPRATPLWPFSCWVIFKPQSGGVGTAADLVARQQSNQIKAGETL